MQSRSARESPLFLQILHHIVLPFSNSPVQTCLAAIVLLKPVLTKPWNEILHHIKVAKVSSKVQGIVTTLLVEDGNISDYINTQTSGTLI